MKTGLTHVAAMTWLNEQVDKANAKGSIVIKLRPKSKLTKQDIDRFVSERGLRLVTLNDSDVEFELVQPMFVKWTLNNMTAGVVSGEKKLVVCKITPPITLDDLTKHCESLGLVLRHHNGLYMAARP